MATGETGIPLTTSRKASSYGEVYKARVWEDLRSLFQQDHLTDIVLAADGQSIPCHRVLLAAASQFFHGKFVANPESLNHNLLDIEGIDFDTLKSVVSFIYSGDIELTPEKALNLCPASIKLMLPELMGLCKDFLLDQLNEYDPDIAFVIDINRMAKENSMENLANRSWQMMLCEFQEVIETDAFKQMSEAELTKYLEDEELFVANEDPVFEAVVTWVRHHIDKRKSSFESLLKHVTLSHCSLNFLRDTVKREPLMMSMGCYEHLAEAFCLHATTIPLQPGTPRKGYAAKLTQPNSLIAVCGGQWWGLKPEISWVKYRVPWMKKKNFGNACVVGEAIVVTGGLDEKQCWKISLQTLEWARLPDLNVARTDHAAVCVGKHIYVLGGIGCDYEDLRSVEYLDEKAGAWCLTSDMPIPLHAHVAVNYNNCIYVFGGFCDTTSEKTFVLETVTKTWSRKTNMPHKGHGTVSLLNRDKIYLHGQLDSSCSSDSENNSSGSDDAEDYGHDNYYFMAYDPKEDQWETLSCPEDVEEPRCSTVWKDRILLYGFPESSEDGSLIEQYNPDTDTWSVFEQQLPNEAQPADYLFAVHLSNRAMRTLKQKLPGQPMLGDIDDVISSIRILYDDM